ncbi:Protein of unknown function [Saccharopolyspora kobensis]|uniref:DUF3040 family protein n=1 Tax=Saccharopolyspora kobensis TaxID=146035 RepID=A0A1H5UJ01_9PSEU|nr:DUF3040 domain-containing protein [Saccharopolyspora kobensis]SEF74448.1 Protein of unknown function [Saccharopolyspora kobensis]SFC73301.1 Protein of unknown function [Saccharopolyspora kobensis]
MLSRHERDRLAEIESALISGDPRLAEKFERFDGRRDWTGVRRFLVFLVFALIMLLAVLCMLSGLVLSAITLFTAAVAGAGALWWRSRRADPT